MVVLEQIPLDKVVCNDDTRFRSSIDEVKLIELMESFKAVGQFTPIVVDRNLKLLAGRTRLEAAKRLGYETIGFVYFESLDPLEQKIVEFDENHKRQQLSWQDEAKAIAEIHELKKLKNYNWSMEQTASSLGISVAKVSEDLTLASSLTNIKVAKRPSRRGALDTMKRERELELVQELARRRTSSLITHPGARVTAFTGGILYNEDCLSILPTLEDNSVDLIVTDPPWGIDFNEASQWTKRWIATYDDSPDAVRLTISKVIPELFRVLKITSHIYCFFPIQDMAWWMTEFTKAGFIMRVRPLVWFKTGQPAITDVYSAFLPCYETFLWGWKPGNNDIKRFFSKPIPEAFGLPRQSGIFHENEKPIEMLERYIETSSEINEVVLDPFAGGGSTLVASFSLGRRYIGIERDMVNYSKTLKRLQDLERAKGESERPT